MTTDLKAGAPFVTRERGEYLLWINNDDETYSPCLRPIVPGDTVFFCVWKGKFPQKRLEPRKSYVVKDGDVAWVDTGRRMLDFSKPGAHECFLFGYYTLNKTLWKNKFTAGPVWLREAT